MDQRLTISDVAASTGIAPSALRYYERRGLIDSTGRAGGKRVYDGSVVEQLALIDLMQQAGFTLSEIANMVNVDGRIDTTWRESARHKLAELDNQLQRVHRARSLIQHSLLCEHPTLHDCPNLRGALATHAATLHDRRQGRGDTQTDEGPSPDELCPITDAGT